MYADQIDNELRRSIFLKLCKVESLPYSKLKPPEVESNQFAYHLKKLKEDGFLEKFDGGYRLAPKGLRLSDHLSFKTERIREQPKLIIIMVILSEDGKKVLAGRRNRQPHINKLVLPGGKIHFGENLEKAAKRTLQEFIPEFEAKIDKSGSAYVKFSKNGICFSHILGEVFIVRVPDLVKLSNDSGGTHDLFWQDLTIGFENWLEGSEEIFNAAQGSEMFNLDLEYNI